MNFIIEFEICSTIIIAILVACYWQQKRLPSKRYKIFSLLTISILVSSILNILTVVARMDTLFLNYFVNELYYLFQVLSLSTFYAFALSVFKVDKKFEKVISYMFYVPSIVLLIFIMINPFVNKDLCLFYFDENLLYTYGEMHTLSYIVPAVTLTFVFIISLTRIKKIEKKELLPILFFLIIYLICQVYQMLNPEYLVTSLASACGLLLFVIIMQAPQEYVDRMTGLFNREAISYFVGNPQKWKKNFSVILLSFDDVQNISFTFGKKVYQSLILVITDFLAKKFDKNYIFRINEDKFIIILRYKKLTKESLIEICDSMPEKWQTSEISVSLPMTLVGFNSFKNSFNLDYTKIIDYLLIKSKKDYFGQITILNDEEIKNFVNEMDIITIVNDIINNEKLEVNFQPEVSIRDNCMGVAAEALARFHFPDNKLIPTDVAIKVAEENGMISKITEIVIEKVCKFIKKVDIRQYGVSTISVNLSVTQFMRPNFLNIVEKILEKYNVQHRYIVFEITETLAISSIKDFKETMELFISHGFNFALDDFGSGYSNVEYFVQLPYEYTKIDKSLIWAYETNPGMKKYLEGIVTTFKSLNRKFLIEGIETERHIEIMNEIGANFVQGYYLSRPLNEEKFIEYLENNKKKMKPQSNN